MISFSFYLAACLPGRTDVQCLHRWQKVLNPELIKGSWTKEVEMSFPRMFFILSEDEESALCIW